MNGRIVYAILEEEAKGGFQGGLVTSIPMTVGPSPRSFGHCTSGTPERPWWRPRRKLVDHQGLRGFKDEEVREGMVGRLEREKNESSGRTTHPEGLSTEDEKAPRTTNRSLGLVRARGDGERF
jgi:hypothetical protein